MPSGRILVFAGIRRVAVPGSGENIAENDRLHIQNEIGMVSIRMVFGSRIPFLTPPIFGPVLSNVEYIEANPTK
jgi:hypothetical protein